MNHSSHQQFIVSAFGSSTAARGKSYWQQGRVHLLGVSEEADERGVGARVRGRQRLPYNTLLSYDPDAPGSLHGSCTCPMRYNCKHVAAVAYAHFATLPAQDDSRVEAWLKRLRKGAGQSTVTPTEVPAAILYLLSLHDGLQVKPIWVQRLKNGSWGKARPVTTYQLRESYSGTHPLDVEIGTLLATLGGARSYYDPVEIALKGQAGRLALTQILASGRCHLDTKDGPLLGQGPSRPLRFEWREVPRGWRLTPVSEPPLTRCLMLAEPWYYDAGDQSLGPLETTIEAAQLAELLKAPPIEPAQLEATTYALLEALPEAQLPVPEGISVAITPVRDVEPLPQLTLRGRRQNTAEPSYCAELEFIYDEVYCPPDKTARRVRIEQDGQLYDLERQPEAEAAALKQLKASGLQRQADGQSFALPAANPMAQVEAWERWLREAAPKLEEQGWTLHVASDFGLNIHTGEQDWQAEVRAEDDQDWFSLSLGVEIDGQPVNLLPILVRLLQQWPESEALLAELDAREYFLLPLGPENWLRVPSQRLRSIFTTLIELYDRDVLSSDGQLELSWFQGLGLDPLLGLDGIAWHGAERLQALVEKLRAFGGMAELALPEGFNATLRPYQQEGYRWLQFLREFGFHGILADDMGLGKTVQTLAHLLLEKQSGRADRPSLVVAPTSVVGNWEREAARFTPDLRVRVLHGQERREAFSELEHYDLLITTYALIRLDFAIYADLEFHSLILDEAHYIKNPQAKTSQLLCRLKARHRLALTGTPMENHLAELWSLFRFLMPGFLGSSERFARLFRTPIEKQADSDRTEELRRRVKPFLLRRSKQEVAQDLPAKTEIVRYVQLSEAQRDLYETVRVAMDARVREEIGRKGLKRSQIMLLDALLKLRQICCDPRLIKLEAAKKVKASAKRELLLEMLPEMVEEGRRILIFSQFVSMLDLIEADLDKHKIPSLRLTGATRQRQAVVDRFQAGEAPVFLISLKAGGVGLNLTAADTVIHYDPWWNPAAENQATDRAWRIGQDKPVFVYKLITEASIEEKILALQARKLQLTSGILTEQAEGELKIEAEELLALLEG